VNSKFLFDESPIALQRPLCVILGSADDAAIVQQIHYWCETNRKMGRESTHFHEGRWWVYNTVDQWIEDLCWLSEGQLTRRLKKLRGKGVVIAEKRNKAAWNHTLWYSIDYDLLHSLDLSKSANRYPQNQQIDTRKIGKTIHAEVTESTIQRIHTKNTTYNNDDMPPSADISELDTSNRYGWQAGSVPLARPVVDASPDIAKYLRKNAQIGNLSQKKSNQIQEICNLANNDLATVERWYQAVWSTHWANDSGKQPHLGQIIKFWNDTAEPEAKKQTQAKENYERNKQYLDAI